MVSVAAVLVSETEDYFEKTAASIFLSAWLLVELRLYDLVEAAVGGGKSVMHLLCVGRRSRHALRLI
jgi:hypothetical protein